MLVSYRGHPKSSSVSLHIPSATKPLCNESDSAVPLPILLKAASEHPRSKPFRADQEGGVIDVEEAGLSVVSLDYNRQTPPFLPHTDTTSRKAGCVSHLCEFNIAWILI